jgi:hypothetical protein
MLEPLPEHQKTQLIVRSPLSTNGFVSVYFSSPEGRLMNEEEWWNLRQLIELTNKVCIRYQASGARQVGINIAAAASSTRPLHAA